MIDPVHTTLRYGAEAGAHSEAEAAFDLLAMSGFPIRRDLAQRAATDNLVLVALRLGRLDEAQGLVERLEPFAATFGHGAVAHPCGPLPRPRRCRPLNHQTAFEHFDAAATVHERCGVPLLLAETLVNWKSAAVTAGRTELATTLAERALAALRKGTRRNSNSKRGAKQMDSDSAFARKTRAETIDLRLPESEQAFAQSRKPSPIASPPRRESFRLRQRRRDRETAPSSTQGRTTTSARHFRKLCRVSTGVDMRNGHRGRSARCSTSAPKANFSASLSAGWACGSPQAVRLFRRLVGGREYVTSLRLANQVIFAEMAVLHVMLLEHYRERPNDSPNAAEVVDNATARSATIFARLNIVEETSGLDRGDRKLLERAVDFYHLARSNCGHPEAAAEYLSARVLACPRTNNVGRRRRLSSRSTDLFGCFSSCGGSGLYGQPAGCSTRVRCPSRSISRRSTRPRILRWLRRSAGVKGGSSGS